MTTDSLESRIARHDSELENIGKRLDQIAANVKAIADAQQAKSGTNWTAIGVGLAFMGTLGALVGYALNAQEERVERLESHHDKEVERNNRLEHWQGREEMLTELYMRGMLKLQ